MNLTIVELERVERRVLGALRCIDATTGAAIDLPLQVELAGSRLQRNRSGLYVIHTINELAGHTSAFAQPPSTPAVASLKLVATLSDPSGRYLPRLVDLALPRDPLPGHGGIPESLFQPIDIPLYPASAAPLGANWAVLRINVSESGGDALGGALLRISKGGTVLARGLTDWRGEALLPVSGVPVTTWSDTPGAVVASEIEVTLEAVFDPAAGSRSSTAAVLAGRIPESLPVVDPDRLERQRASLPHSNTSLAIAARRTQSLPLVLTLP